MNEKAILFLLGIQHFLRSIESLFIDTVSMMIPWLSPLVPAYLTYRSMIRSIGFPTWLALTTALVVELLGLATINTFFSFMAYNQEKRKTDPASPVILAAGVSLYYILVLLVVNTILDNSPLTIKLANGLLSSISIVGGVTIAIRSSHARRTQGIELDKEKRREERHYAKIGKVTNHSGLENANQVRKNKKESVMNSLEEYCRENPGANITQMAKAVGRSRTAIYQYLSDLEQNGRIIQTNSGIQVNGKIN